MAYRRRRERMALNAEINVVNLIDVMLLLLVIFMLTAPMMTGGVDLTLPSADATPIESKSGLTVQIDRNGQIYVGDQRMTFEQFRATFPTFAAQRGRQGIDLQADTSVQYGVLGRVLAVMAAAGVTNVGLPMIPEDPRR